MLSPIHSTNENASKIELEIIYGPGSLKYEPLRPLAIFQNYPALEKFGYKLPDNYQLVTLSREQFGGIQGFLASRRNVVIIDDGDKAWRADLEQMLLSVQAKITKLIEPLQSVNIKELLTREIPPRIMILPPWLPSQGLAGLR
jgi:hypothetical protein